MDAPTAADVLKVAMGVAIGLIPTAKRVIGSLGKTEVELADEAVHAAVAAQERAHANADPNDDALADERVARAEELRRKARRLGAIADALAAETR